MPLAMHAAYLETLPEDQKHFLGMLLGFGCNFEMLSQRTSRSIAQCKKIAAAFYKDEVRFMQKFWPTGEQLIAVSNWSAHPDKIRDVDFAKSAKVSLSTASAWLSSTEYCEHNCKANACIYRRRSSKGKASKS